MAQKLSHFDEDGASRMVDVGDKEITKRMAIARGKVCMRKETWQLIVDKEVQKGDVLEVARVAGIMAAKQVSSLIPLCHPLNLDSVRIDYRTDEQGSIEIQAEVKVTARTGAEMEALTAVSVAALTIYDMCKAVDRGMVISDIRLCEKSGGKSGTWKRP